MDRRHFIRNSALAATAGLSSSLSAKVTHVAAEQYNFVLVHGTWHGGWQWRDVRNILRARGHQVFTPTCTGCGERVHLSHPDVGLETHIEDIANVIRFEELNNVVLVGHSYAGLTITGVADRLRERIKHLVYLDAIIPHEGVMSGVARDPNSGELPTRWIKYAEKFKDGYLMNFWDSYPAEMLIPPTETALVERLKTLLTTHPAKQWTDQLELKNGGWQGLPRSYIHCVGQTFHKSSERMVAPARQPGWHFLELNIPRDGMLTHPKLVADSLEQLAAKGSA